MTKRVLLSAAAVAIAFLGVLLFEQTMHGVLAFMLVIVAASIVVMAVGMTWRPIGELPFLCDPYVVQCLFLSQFFVIGSLALGTWDLMDFPFLRMFAPERPVQALLGFLMMTVMSLIGYHLQVGSMVAGNVSDFFRPRTRLPGWWIEAAIVIASLAGMVGWIYFQGGLVAKLSRGYGMGRAGGAMFLIAHTGILVGTLLTAWRATTARRKVAPIVTLLGLLAIQTLYFGVLQGARKYLFYLFFGLLTIWLLRRGGSRLPKVRILIVAALLLGYFSFWGMVRFRPVTELVAGAENPRVLPRQEGFYSGYMRSVAEPFGVACVVWEVFPNQEPFRLGDTLLVTALGFIPRSVWPEKPIGIGKEITRYFVGPHYNPTSGLSLAPTVPADFYLNFGWAGIILGGLALGIVYRGIATYAVAGMRDGVQYRAARVLVPAVFIMGMAELRGDMATMLAFYILAYLPLSVAIVFFDLDAHADSQPSRLPA